MTDYNKNTLSINLNGDAIPVLFKSDDDLLKDAIDYVDEKFKKDIKVVKAAVKQNKNAIQYASTELTADRDIVNEAIKQNKSALHYAELKETKYI